MVAKLRLTFIFALCMLWSMLTSCTASGGPYADPTLPVGGGRSMTAKSAYPMAKARAQAWQHGAKLELVYMSIPAEEVATGPLAITYVFWSDHALGPIHWADCAFIQVDTNTGEVLSFEEYRGSTSNQRFGKFDIDAAILDSSDALAQAEALGGTAYRDSHPGASVRIDGSVGLSPGQLIWDVGHFSPEGAPSDDLTFGVDAMTGQVRGGTAR